MNIRWISTLAIFSALAGPAFAHKNSEGKLIPDDLAAGDQFGFSVDIDRSTAVASAPRQDPQGTDSGAVYVYARSGIDWLEQAKLLASDGRARDLFGYSVAVDADTIAVGAPFASAGMENGAVYIFVRSGTTWTEQAILTPTVTAAGDRFGLQVALSGDTLIAGAPNEDSLATDAGSAVVFVRTGTTWSEQAVLTAGDGAAGDFFGTAVSIDGERALVGSILADGSAANTGAAYLYQRTGTSWAETLKFTELESTTGDRFGAAVSLEGTWLTIGAPGHDAIGSNAGQAFYYEDIAGVWTSTLTRFGVAANDQFGASADNRANGYFVTGSAGDDEQALNAGKAWLFMVQPPFGLEILLSEEPVAGDQLGTSVALSADCWSVVGAPGHDDAGANAGSVDIFTLVGNPVHYCTAGTSANGCQATVEATGVPSADAPDGFIIEVSSLDAGKDGLFFYSTNGQQAVSWGNGNSFRCVVPPVKRGGILLGSGTPGTCDGVTSQDLNTRWQQKPNHNPGSGATIQIQFWYRDPTNTSNQTSSLSDAVQVTLCP